MPQLLLARPGVGSPERYVTESCSHAHTVSSTPADGLRKGSPTLHADSDRMAQAAGFACFRDWAANLEATAAPDAAVGEGVLALAAPPPPKEELEEGQKAGKRTKPE